LAGDFDVVEVAASVFEPVLFDSGGGQSTPSLIRLPRSASAWVNVFDTPRGPLPAHVRSLSQLHFVELDRWLGPRPVVDVLTYALAGRGTPVGAPLVIRSAFEPGATLQPLEYGDPDPNIGFGVDIRSDLVGRFQHPVIATVLSYAEIIRCAQPPVPSDVLALATVYNRTLPAQLSDRSPGNGCGVPLGAPVPVELGAGERAELEASFVAPAGNLSGVRIVVERVLVGTDQILEEVSVPLAGRADHLEYVFQQGAGSYRVRVFYDARAEPSATWLIQVEGDTCGNALLDPEEECDNGEANSDVSADACRLTCVLPTCGDGVLDSSEQCEPALSPGTCTPLCHSITASCGNGMLEADEECDDGAANSDTQPDACRTSCRLPFCGDLVVDTGEDCDPPDGDAYCTPLCQLGFG
jgi:hypothetical protein